MGNDHLFYAFVVFAGGFTIAAVAALLLLIPLS